MLDLGIEIIHRDTLLLLQIAGLLTTGFYEPERLLCPTDSIDASEDVVCTCWQLDMTWLSRHEVVVCW